MFVLFPDWTSIRRKVTRFRVKHAVSSALCERFAEPQVMHSLCCQLSYRYRGRLSMFSASKVFYQVALCVRKMTVLHPFPRVQSAGAAQQPCTDEGLGNIS